MNTIFFDPDDFYDDRNSTVRFLYWKLKFTDIEQAVILLNGLSLPKQSIAPLHKITQDSLLFVLNPKKMEPHIFKTLAEKIILLGTDLSHQNVYGDTFLSGLLLASVKEKFKENGFDFMPYISMALDLGSDVSECNGVALARCIKGVEAGQVASFLEDVKTYSNFYKAMDSLLHDARNFVEFEHRKKMHVANLWFVDFQQTNIQKACGETTPSHHKKRKM